MGGCCKNCCTCCTITCCILIIMHGILLIVVGSMVLKDDKRFDSQPIMGISMGGGGVTIGVFVIVASAVGLYGGFKDKKWFLYGYVAALLLLGITIFALGIKSTSTLLDSDNFRISIENKLKTIFAITLPVDKQKLSKIDDIQQYYGCCGVFKDTWIIKPASCYSGLDMLNGHLYNGTCSEEVHDQLISRTVLFAVVSFLYGLFWCIAGLCVLCAACRLSSSEDDE